MIRIGTSGWNYKHWKGRFYPQKLPADQYLAYYSQEFDTVEINTSFYHLVSPATYAHWNKATPARFLFSIKGSRYLTHIKRLLDTGRGVRRFFDPLKKLKKKRGPVLFQLPPNSQKNTARLDHFLSALPKADPIVFEFRHASWFSSDVYATLRRHHTAFCVYDFQDRRVIPPKEVTSQTVYIRFHGGGAYRPAGLRPWAKWILEQDRRGRDVFCYFNNDAEGHALDDARILKKMLGV
jgi:uncharacterized protein YecE (DUF72 family)